MQKRFFFPLFKSTQILGGAAYHQEIKKLQNIASLKILPFIQFLKFRKYPFKITFTFFVFDDCDMITAGILSSYILHLMESHGVLQSCDSRVVSEICIKKQNIITKEREGVEIKVEKFIHKCEAQTSLVFEP